MANAFLVAPLDFTVTTDGFAAPGSSFSYAGNDYAGVVWRSQQADNIVVVVDFGGDVAIDTALLFGVGGVITGSDPALRIAIATNAQGPGFGGFSVPDGQGVGNYWLDPITTSLFAGSNGRPGRGVTLWTASPVARPTAARYLYLNFIGLAATDHLVVARLAAGARTHLERNYSIGEGLGVRDLGTFDFSRRGVLLRSRGAKLRTRSLTFSNIYQDELEAQTRPLMEAIGNTECVALVTDPSPHPDRQNRCYFGPLVGDLSHSRRNAKAWEAKINLVSLF